MKQTTHRPLRAVMAMIMAIAMCIALMIPAFAASAPSASLFAGGSGTEKDPYKISTVEQMKAINFDLDASYELVNDIDFSKVAGVWLPIGYFMPDLASGDMEAVSDDVAFTGNFDGNGYTLKNLEVATANIICGGVFGTVAGDAYIHDVNLKNIKMTGFMAGAGLCGWAAGTAVFENIKATAVNVTSVLYAGSIIGCSNSGITLKDITAKANCKVVGPSSLGGYAGIVVGGGEGASLENCKAIGGKVTAAMDGVAMVGGLAGCVMDGKYVRNCSVSNVTIKTGKAAGVGALIGEAGTQAGLKKASKALKVTNCKVNNVKIVVGEGSERIGGLIGSGLFLKGEEATIAEPLAVVVNGCSVSDVTIKNGKYVGTVIGYMGRNSAVRSTKVKGVTWNGKNLTKTIGANYKTVPVSSLTL